MSHLLLTSQVVMVVGPAVGSAVFGEETANLFVLLTYSVLWSVI